MSVKIIYLTITRFGDFGDGTKLVHFASQNVLYKL